MFQPEAVQTEVCEEFGLLVELSNQLFLRSVWRLFVVCEQDALSEESLAGGECDGSLDFPSQNLAQ